MGRAPCCVKGGLKRGPWTPEEDQMLTDYIQKHGHGSWRTLPKHAGLERCGKSCRLRWTNYLRPDIKRGRFSFDEEETIIQLHSVLGNKWSAIAARLPGRTDNEIKNYWNTHIRKRLLRMGIDPITHNRRVDLSDLYSLLTPQLHNSSQLNFSTLLGIQPLVNSELLRLAASLLSSQTDVNNLLLQNLHEYQLGNSQFQDQNQFQSFQANQLQASVAPYNTNLNEVQFVQSPHNVDHQLQSNPIHFNCNTPQPNVCQNNILVSNIIEHPSAANHSYNGSNQQCTGKMFPESSIFQSHNSSDQNPDFASVVSTPSSTLTPLSPCSTYTSTIEDERDSFCSNLLQFEISDIFDMNEFM